MSLIRETVDTVIEGKYLVLNHALNTQFINAPNKLGYNVVTGTLIPRAQGNILAVDNFTGEPIQLPANSVPLYFFLVPVIPMQSADLSSAYISVTLSDDFNFSSTYAPWGSDGDFTGEELQYKNLFVPGVNDEYMSDFAPYPYIGASVNDDDFTDGQVQIYVYYVTSQKPSVV